MDLESFRKSRGLTQSDLASALGLRSKGYISQLESRAVRCPLKLALKIQRLSDGKVTAASLCPEARDLLQGRVDEGAGAPA